MLRLIERLAKDGHIKSIKTILKLGETTKPLHFVCEPNLSASDSFVKSAIEQAKVKFFSMPVAAKNSTTWFKTSKTPLDDDDYDSDAEIENIGSLAKVEGDGDGDCDSRTDAGTSTASVSHQKKSYESSSSKRGASAAMGEDAGSDVDLEEEKPKKRRRKAKLSPSTSPGIAVGFPLSVQDSFEKVRSRLCPLASNDSKDKGTGKSSEKTSGKSTNKEKAENEPKMLEYVPGMAKKYGVLPKMMRLQVGFVRG